MRIRILFFASLTDVTGAPEITVEVSEHSTVGSVLGELTVRFPGLDAYRGRILSAINSVYATRETLLKDGDEVAFFPPVSGG
jgi:molybdopterin synthase sulfur carrier subunit